MELEVGATATTTLTPMTTTSSTERLEISTYAFLKRRKQ